MNVRVITSVNLLIFALILVLLPKNEVKSGQLSPIKQLTSSIEYQHTVSVDKAARFLNNQDTTIQFIDIRTKDEYLTSSIPGAINIPYTELLMKEWQGYLKQKTKTTIIYGNGDTQSSLAQALLLSNGYANIGIIEGGLNKWYSVIMNSDFKGERLSARENALYENRQKAKTLYIEINSLPDSLKNTFLEAKILEEKQLDGGCE